MPHDNVFPIIDFYLDLARRGEIIKAYRNNTSLWFDVGKIRNLKTLQKIISEGKNGLLDK